MTLREALKWGQEQLTAAGIEEAALDAWYLLETVTGIDRAAYYAAPEKRMPAEAEENYCKLINKRSRRIPLQHITGKQEFMGLDFAVNEHVLVPRQDTECLVELVEQKLKKIPSPALLDVCTGSGCILISLMKRLGLTDGTGTDISEAALAVAEQNAGFHRVPAKFIKSDLFEQVEGQFDVIVSNPPYIRTDEIEKLEHEVRLYDPFIALDGKEDGLFFYRKIISRCSGHLKEGGCLYFEIGYDQGRAVSELMHRHGFERVEVMKDLSGLDRVVSGVYNIERREEE